MIKGKQVLSSERHAVVTFDITGSVSDLHNCGIKGTKSIENKISNQLGLDVTLIEVRRPQKIPNGLRMVINIHLNFAQTRDIDYE